MYNLHLPSFNMTRSGKGTTTRYPPEIVLNPHTHLSPAGFLGAKNALPLKFGQQFFGCLRQTLSFAVSSRAARRQLSAIKNSTHLSSLLSAISQQVTGKATARDTVCLPSAGNDTVSDRVRTSSCRTEAANHAFKRRHKLQG